VELVGEAGRQAAAVEPTDEILSLTERGNGLRQARPGSGSCQKPRRAIARTDVRVRSPRYAARPNVRGRRRQIAATPLAADSINGAGSAPWRNATASRSTSRSHMICPIASRRGRSSALSSTPRTVASRPASISFP